MGRPPDDPAAQPSPDTMWKGRFSQDKIRALFPSFPRFSGILKPLESIDLQT